MQEDAHRSEGMIPCPNRNCRGGYVDVLVDDGDRVPRAAIIPPRRQPAVVASWLFSLPLQQQSVVLLGSRGPDFAEKDHPCKKVVRAYRGTVFMAAKFGRFLTVDDEGDTFMTLRAMRGDDAWEAAVTELVESNIAMLGPHYLSHLMHGAQIMGYHHPDRDMGRRWGWLHHRIVHDCFGHSTPETREQMDERLSDWDRQFWEPDPTPPTQPARPAAPAGAASDGSHEWGLDRLRARFHSGRYSSDVHIPADVAHAILYGERSE